MPKKPNFNDPSWDTTFWSLWGLLYTGAASDQELKTAISQKYGETRALLNQLSPQVDPMKKKVKEWKQELDSYGRTITYGEANDTLERLKQLYNEINQQVQRDKQMVRSGTKLPPKGKVQVMKIVSAPSSSDSDDEEDDDEDLEWALRYQNSIVGHSPATAKNPPKPVAKPYVPPTPQEAWRNEQRDMAARCDNGIRFGAHPVTQQSVINRLNLAPNDGNVQQYRVGPENSHERVMTTRLGLQFWTLGLTHQALRDAGDFSVYLRDGGSNRFSFIAGRRHPRDPGP